ncbi:MAG: plasmid recombination protein, partial [Devosia sp.]
MIRTALYELTRRGSKNPEVRSCFRFCDHHVPERYCMRACRLHLFGENVLITGDTPMFAILRVERIKNLSDLSAASRHGARNDSGTHYDPKRTKLNRHWRLGELVTAPVDLIEARKALIEQQGLTARANGAVAAEMLLSASGEFFFDEQTGELREDQLEVWLQRNIEAVNNRFPRMVAAMRLDLDEGTPHLSVFLVPHY